MRISDSFKIAVLAMGCGVVLAACSHGADQPSAAEPAAAATALATANAQAPVRADRQKSPTNPSNTAAPTWLPSSGNKGGAAAAAGFAGFADVGVPACDSLAKRVVQCLDTHGTGKAQAIALHGAFAGKVVSWRKLLAAGANEQAVADQCAQYKSDVAGAYWDLGCREF